jgi:hypothetical protein
MIADKQRESKVRNNELLQLTGNGDYAEYHEWRLLCSDAFRDAGFADLADKFWSCAADNSSAWFDNHPILPDDPTIAHIYVCKEHGVRVLRKTCYSRICPDCARRRVSELIARFMPEFEKLIHAHHSRFRFRKIVLTTPYSLTSPDAVEQYNRLRSAIPDMFDKLLPDGWRKNQGFIVSDEFGPDGLKLHFHILFYGQWLDNKAAKGYPLASTWREVTGGDCEVVYIAGVRGEDILGELMETLKYCVKFWETDPDTGEVKRLSPALMVALHKLLKGRRRVRSYGIFRNVPPPPDRPVCCPVCHEEMERVSREVYEVFVVTGWLYAEQKLYLRTGDKSPPQVMPGNGDRRKPECPALPEAYQPPLSEEFERSSYALSYLR